MVTFDTVTSVLIVLGGVLVGFFIGTVVQGWNFAVLLRRSGMRWVGDYVVVDREDEPEIEAEEGSGDE